MFRSILVCLHNFVKGQKVSQFPKGSEPFESCCSEWAHPYSSLSLSHNRGGPARDGLVLAGRGERKNNCLEFVTIEREHFRSRRTQRSDRHFLLYRCSSRGGLTPTLSNLKITQFSPPVQLASKKHVVSG